MTPDKAALVRTAKHHLRSTVRAYLTATIAANQPLREAKSRAIAAHLTAHPLFTSAHSVSIFLSMAHEVDTHFLVQAALLAGKRVYVPCMVPCTSDSDGPPLPPPATSTTTTTTGRKKKRTKLAMVPLRDADDYASLPLDKWGIPTPADPEARLPWASNTDTNAATPTGTAPVDLVLVPGVAFDVAHGGRCGYGRGFYDDWFARHGGNAKRCAVAFDAQVLDLVDAIPKTVAAEHAQAEEWTALQDVKAQLHGKVPIEDHDVRVQWVVTESGGVIECGNNA